MHYSFLKSNCQLYEGGQHELLFDILEAVAKWSRLYNERICSMKRKFAPREENSFHLKLLLKRQAKIGK